jgi:type III pantothenate kinase
VRAGEPAAAVSVHPGALDRLRNACPGLSVLGEDLPLPIPVAYEPPSACGSDRVAGAFGALGLRPDAAAILLLDAGTCLTATVALRTRGVIGGAILPGPELMARALKDGTAGLPLVSPERPSEPIGRSTEGSIRAGIHAAVAGAAGRLITAARAAVSGPLDVVACGTGAESLALDVPEIDAVEPFATLWGVFLAHRASAHARGRSWPNRTAPGKGPTDADTPTCRKRCSGFA